MTGLVGSGSITACVCFRPCFPLGCSIFLIFSNHIHTYINANTGLELWERTREEWLAHNSNRNGNDTDSTTRAVAVPVEVDDIIDVIFAPRWRGVATPDDEAGPPKRFPQNVPLPQMVDILQDLWEAEGLDV